MESENKNWATRAVVCPYCPEKNRRSRMFALYKLFRTPTGKYKCVCKACHKSFLIDEKGNYIIKESMVEVINNANNKDNIIKRR